MCDETFVNIVDSVTTFQRKLALWLCHLLLHLLKNVMSTTFYMQAF